MQENTTALLVFLVLLGFGTIVEAADMDVTGNRIAYSVGITVGENLRERQLNTEALLAGISDGIAQKSKITAAERQNLLTHYQQQLQEAQQAEWQKQGDGNLLAANTFLKNNAKEKGITELKSGLQYRVLRKGKNTKKPKATDTVTVHYKGTLLNDQEFDSSYSRNEPASFPLNRVIAGWTEGVQLMTIGDRFEFFIPPHLGYGANGAPPNIGPNEALVFEVELLDIK